MAIKSKNDFSLTFVSRIRYSLRARFVNERFGRKPEIERTWASTSRMCVVRIEYRKNNPHPQQVDEWECMIFRQIQRLNRAYGMLILWRRCELSAFKKVNRIFSEKRIDPLMGFIAQRIKNGYTQEKYDIFENSHEELDMNKMQKNLTMFAQERGQDEFEVCYWYNKSKLNPLFTHRNWAECWIGQRKKLLFLV